MILYHKRIGARVDRPSRQLLTQSLHVAGFERRAGVHLGPAAKPVEAKYPGVDRPHQREVRANNALEEVGSRWQSLQPRLIVERRNSDEPVAVADRLHALEYGIGLGQEYRRPGKVKAG